MPADSALVLDSDYTSNTHEALPQGQALGLHLAVAHAAPPPPPVLVSIGTKKAFAKRDVFTPAWLPMCASRELTAGNAKPRVVDIGVMRIVLWRDASGAVCAVESRCPHMGADLGQGRVVDGELRCALHHWRFRGNDGACTHSTSSTPIRRCARTFPVIEKYGVVFVYPASTPAIAFPELPDGDDAASYRAVVLDEAVLKCHWHLPSANGLDPLHFEGLHGLTSVSPWHHDVDEANHAVHLHLHHEHKNPVLRVLLGELESRFSSHGPSIAWVTAKAPVRMHALFATRPAPGGEGCVSRAVLFLPRKKPIATLRVLAFVVRLLWQDNKVLNAMHDFRPGFVDTDAPLRAHVAMVNRSAR